MNILDILNPDVAFDGWAVALIGGIVSLFFVVYKTYSRVTQKQKSGKKAQQSQNVKASTIKDKTVISQKQNAGDNSVQSQNA